MATQEDEYLADLLETIIEHNDRHKVPLSNEKLLQSVSMNTFIHSPITTKTSREKVDVPNERQIS